MSAAKRFEVSSSDGWNRLLVQVGNQRWRTDDEVLAVCSVTIVGKFPSRDPLAGNQPTEDFHVALPEVVLRRELLLQLTAELAAWLDVPKEFELELSGVEEQSLRIALGVRSEYISKVDRPVLTINYRGGRMLGGEWAFVVDQSCLRILHDGLAEALG